MRKILLLFVICGAANAQQAVKRDLSCTAAGASSTTYTCSIPVAPSGYVTNQEYMFVADVANTGSSTINFNSLGAKTIKKLSAGVKSNLVANDLGIGYRAYMVYDGIDMVLISPPGTGGSGGTTVNNVTNINLRCQKCTLDSTVLTNTWPNNAGTGTTLNKLAKLTGAPSTVVLMATSDTTGALGVCDSGCGTTGNSEITIQGTGSCVYDNATVAGDYVTISTSTAGDCHSNGATPPIGTQPIGYVLETAAAGTRSTYFFGPAGLSQGGTKTVQAFVLGPTDATTVSNGKYYFTVPVTLNAYRLTGVSAQTLISGSTGVTEIALTRCVAAATGDTCSSTTVQMLSTNMTIDSGENSTVTAATPAVINTSNATITTNQVIRVDIATINTTPALGLIVNMNFTTP